MNKKNNNKINIMMNSKIHRTLGLGLIMILYLSVSSCTDLTESTPSAFTPDEFFKTPKQNAAALGAAYAHFGGGSTNSYAVGFFMRIQEYPTEEFTVPQRGQDWYNGGQPIRFHKHNWTVDDTFLNNGWVYLYGGVNISNRLIYQFKKLSKEGKIKKQTTQDNISELSVLRAFWYYWLLSDFGNVPIVTKFKGASKAPSNNSDFQAGRTALFNQIEKTVKNNISNLDRTASPYHMTAWGAHFLLAKLYLNAKVFTGKPRWQDALAQCDSIIKSGKFRLTSDYFANFYKGNENSPEFIFAIPYDETYFTGNEWARISLHSSRLTYGTQFANWNGWCTLEDFYNSFKANDERRKGFKVGFLFDQDGDYIIDPGEFAGSPHGDTVYITPHINELQPLAWRDAGARFIKYKPYSGAKQSLDNDVPIFRYADVLLMKAECLWRLNKNPGVALHLVNKVRARAGLKDYSSLSAYKILKERGHEFYTELWRREDLIRFDGGMHYHYKPNGQRGKSYPSGETAFNDAWWTKSVSPSYRNVYPIPANQIGSNPNLHQNPGY